MSAWHRKPADRTEAHFVCALSQVFRQAQEEAASEGKSRKTIATADGVEVARVLGARSDYDCLQVLHVFPYLAAVPCCHATTLHGGAASLNMIMLVCRHLIEPQQGHTCLARRPSH